MWATWGRIWAAFGPSGMTADQVRSVLEKQRDSDLFHHIAQLLARTSVPSEALLQKPSGGIRGIWSEDSAELAPAIDRATLPLSTWAGT